MRTSIYITILSAALGMASPALQKREKEALNEVSKPQAAKDLKIEQRMAGEAKVEEGNKVKQRDADEQGVHGPWQKRYQDGFYEKFNYHWPDDD